MQKKNAILIINNLIKETQLNKNFECKEWIIKVDSITKELFGKDSTEFKNLLSIKNSTNYNSEDSYNREIAIKYSKLLPIFSETILIKGVYKKPKVNFLSTLSDSALATIFTFAIPILITIGVYFGNIYSDRQNIELRKTVTDLKNQILHFQVSTLPNTNRISNSDTNKKNKKN